jgi:hypothetical protein
MSIDFDYPPAVRQNISWKPSAFFALTAFVLTLLGIQLWWQYRTANVGKAASATTIVEQCPTIPLKQSGALYAKQPIRQAVVSPKTVQYIKDQITSPDFVRQAWKDLGVPTSAAEIEKFRRALTVEILESPLSGKCLRLSIAWPNSQEAAKRLKALSHRFADRYRTARIDRNDQNFDDAQAAAEQAGRAFDNALAMLDYVRYLSQIPTDAAMAETPADADVSLSEQQNARPSVTVAEPSKEENPEWSALQKKIAELQKKRSMLLEKRTVAHPEVKDLQDQIHECETQLALVPRWISKGVSPLFDGERPAAKPVESMTQRNRSMQNIARQKGNRNGASSLENGENWDQALLQLENHVQSTAQAYCEAVAREKAALGQRDIAPELTVEVLPARKNAPRIAQPSERPLTWLVGVMMAFGVGLIFTGKTIEPPLGSIGELQKVAEVPLIGIVPDFDAGVDPKTARNQKTLLRRSVFFGGFFLIAYCGWVIVQFL